MDLWATLLAKGYVRASFAAAASPALLHAASAVARHCADCRMLKKDYPSYACLPTRMRRMLILARSFSFLIFTLHISISEVLPSFARAAFRALRPVIFVHHDHSVHIHVIFFVRVFKFYFLTSIQVIFKMNTQDIQISFQLSLCWGVFLLKRIQFLASKKNAKKRILKNIASTLFLSKPLFVKLQTIFLLTLS